MKLYQAIKYFRWQTGLLAGVCVVLVSVLAFFLSFPPYRHTHDLVCRANLRIVRDDVEFKGIVDVKSSGLKGISNINGMIRKDDQTYTVQRTVLFTHQDYGISPIWTSRTVIPSNRETVTASVLEQILPKFYIEHSSVSNVDIFPINKTAYLITKEGLPYFYCQKYDLPDRE